LGNMSCWSFNLMLRIHWWTGHILNWLSSTSAHIKFWRELGKLLTSWICRKSHWSTLSWAWYVLRSRFPGALAGGPASSEGGANVMSQTRKE
jgi:hypothetical protein